MTSALSKLLCVVVAGLAFCLPAAAGDLVIHAGSLLDGVGEAPRQRMSILVRDHRIVAVESGYVDPPGAVVIDLSAATVLPGLYADLVATAGNPLEDTAEFQRVEFVMKGGAIFRQNGVPATTE